MYLHYMHVLLRCVLQKKTCHWHEKFKINCIITDTTELQCSSQLKTTALIFNSVPHFPLFIFPLVNTYINSFNKKLTAVRDVKMVLA